MARRGGTPENLIPAKKGEIRNPKGRPPILPELRDVITKILSDEKDGMSALEAIIKRLTIKAIGGDTRAATELLDRYYGKSMQRIDHTTQGDKIIQPTLTESQIDKLIEKL